MTCAIQQRNEGLQPDTDDFCYIIDEGTAKKRKIESNFRKIVALLDPKIVSLVAKRFEDDMWRWLGLFFKANAVYAQRDTAAIREMERITDRPKPDINNVLKMNPNAFLSTGSSLLFYDPGLNTPAKQLESAISRFEKLDYEHRMFFMTIHNEEEVREHIDTSVSKDLLSFRVADPLATCFALIWLVDSGSSLPFLYLPGVAVVTSAAQELPWANDCSKKFIGR